MKKNKADAIFHPVRIRIVQALFGNRRLTAQQFLQAIGGSSIATLYRHLNLLVQAEIITVVEKRPVRGTLEKVYGIAHEKAVLFQPEELREISPQDQLRHFNTLVGTLLNDFNRYINQDSFDRHEDGVIIRQTSLSLTDKEARELREVIRDAIKPYFDREPDPEHKRRILTTILLPIIENPTDNTKEKETL
jgi:DNA-binding transcriptional ArsR family regulator